MTRDRLYADAANQNGGLLIRAAAESAGTFGLVLAPGSACELSVQLYLKKPTSTSSFITFSVASLMAGSLVSSLIYFK